MGLISRFLGRTDKYNPKIGDGNNSDPDTGRQTRYSENWRAYFGIGINDDRIVSKIAPGTNREGQTNAKINYNRVLVDRINGYAFSKPWAASLDHPPIKNAEADAAETTRRNKLAEMLRFADDIFHKENPGDALRLESGLYSAVTGDVFLVALPILPESLELDLYGNDIKASIERSKIRVMTVNSAYCDPTYGPDGETIVRMQIEYPVNIMEGAEVKQGVFKQVITASKIYETTTDIQGMVLNQKEIDNQIGTVYCVHIKNFPIPGVFGIDDIGPIAGAVQELNDKMSDISDIIDYHAAPTTIVFGARASSLEKGANKVWSGLPKDAKVENLELTGDLSAATGYITNLREMLKEVSGVTDAAIGADMAISNTSGVALQVRFYPMQSIAEQKWASWNHKVKRLYQVILLWGRSLKRVSFSNEELANFMSVMVVAFSPNLPKDELMQIQKVSEKVEKRLMTRRQGLRELGSRDPDADMRDMEQESIDFPKISASAGGNRQGKKPVDSDDSRDINQGSTGRNISGMRDSTEVIP